MLGPSRALRVAAVVPAVGVILLLATSATRATLLVNAEPGGGCVAAFDELNGEFIDCINPGGGGGMVFGPDDRLYITRDNFIIRLNSAGEDGEVFVVPPDGEIFVGMDIDFGPDGNFYISKNDHPSSPEGGILRYDSLTGDFLDFFVPQGSGGLGDAGGLFSFTFGPDDNLYVVDILQSVGSRVLRYDGLTGEFIDVFIDLDPTFIFDLQFGPDDNLYVSNRQGGQILRYDGTTGSLIDEFVSLSAFGDVNITGFDFGLDGSVYMAANLSNGGNANQLVRFDPASNQLQVLTAPDTGFFSGKFLLIAPLQLQSPPISIPEPTTLSLFAMGLAGLGFMMRRRCRRRVHAFAI